MPEVARLLTVVDLDDLCRSGRSGHSGRSGQVEHPDPGEGASSHGGPDDGPSRSYSLSARHEAVLDDGRHLLLLGDRGWGASGPADIWSMTSVGDLEGMARMVVGPDEPPPGRSQADEEAGHWRHLSDVLRGQGVHADAGRLRTLPHDVVLSERVLARIEGGTARS